MKGSSLLEGASSAVAKITALVATFFLFPPIFSATVHHVEGFARKSYGYDMVSIAHFGWIILCALLIFAISQFLITLTLRLIPFLFVNNR